MKPITKETYLKWYEEMLFWRKFEDKLAAVYIQQKVRGFLHLYNGQEAVLAGALHVMNMDKDRMITAYRNHVMPIGMLIDQKMNDGLPVNFFNKVAMTAPAIAKFALKFRCQIVPALCIREKGIKYKIEYFKPIQYSFLKKLGSEEKIMLYLNKIIERWIIEHPEQWIWVHDRWKN